MRRLKFALLATSVAALHLSPAVAQISTAPATEADSASPVSINDIIVTARKRRETLIDAPVAITAFTDQAIKEAGFANLTDISLQTPGFQFNQQGGQEPGRYNTQLRFRGMNTSQFSPSFATGALFIDGVYVLNGGTSVSLLDLERVEVIKGPQSAQFGRNTFGGAVNLITRKPSLTEYSGELDALGSTRGRFDIQGLVEGPIVRDILSASIGARYYSKRGEYVATDGGRLGNEMTRAVTGVLNFEPSSHFSVRVRGFYSEDRDGAPAGGFIDGDINDSCNGKTLTTPSGERVTPKRYVCGALPAAGSVRTLTGQPLYSTNTVIIRPFVQGAVNLPARYSVDFFTGQPLPSGVPTVGDVALVRNSTRFSAIVNYNIGGFNFDLVAGINRQRVNWIRDADLTDTFGSFQSDPQKIDDRSIEFRVSSPQDKPIRAMVGVNYYSQDFITGGTGGNVVLGCVVTIDQTSFNNCQFPFQNKSTYDNSDATRVFGIFGSLEWDVTRNITLSFEGRQQRDKLTKGGTPTLNGVSADSITEIYNKFLPRAIVRWKPSPATTLYASYAIGAIPGDVNASYLRADAREKPQYTAQFPGLSNSTGQEVLKAWEVGFKQRAFGNRLYIGLAAYYQDWYNIKGRVTATINQTCRSAGVGVLGCDPTVNPAAAVGQPETVRDANGGLTPFFRGNNVLVTGDGRIYGGELESRLAISDQFDVEANVAWAHARYQNYLFNFVQAIAGFTQQRGNVIPRFPEWSGNAAFSWHGPINATTKGFARLDVIYFGKAYTDESNLAYAKGYARVNLRGGVEIDRFRFEAFVNNLLDDDNYAAASRYSNFSRPVNFSTFTQHQGINVSPQPKREFGLRVIARF